LSVNWEADGAADVDDELHRQCRKESSGFQELKAFPAILRRLMKVSQVGLLFLPLRMK
jgi:hypothetical protein